MKMYLVGFMMAPGEFLNLWMDYPPMVGTVITLPDGSGRYAEVTDILDILTV